MRSRGDAGAAAARWLLERLPTHSPARGTRRPRLARSSPAGCSSATRSARATTRRSTPSSPPPSATRTAASARSSRPPRRGAKFLAREESPQRENALFGSQLFSHNTRVGLLELRDRHPRRRADRASSSSTTASARRVRRDLPARPLAGRVPRLDPARTGSPSSRPSRSAPRPGSCSGSRWRRRAAPAARRRSAPRSIRRCSSSARRSRCSPRRRSSRASCASRRSGPAPRLAVAASSSSLLGAALAGVPRACAHGAAARHALARRASTLRPEAEREVAVQQRRRDRFGEEVEGLDAAAPQRRERRLAFAQQIVQHDPALKRDGARPAPAGAIELGVERVADRDEQQAMAARRGPRGAPARRADSASTKSVRRTTARGSAGAQRALARSAP